MDELAAVADALYAGPVDAFTEARNQAAKRGRRQGAGRPDQEAEEAVGRRMGGEPARPPGERADRLRARAGRAAARRGRGARRRRAAGVDQAAPAADQRAGLVGEVAGPRRGCPADRSGRRPGGGHAHRRDARSSGRPGGAHRADRHRVQVDRGLRARRRERGRRAGAIDVRATPTADEAEDAEPVALHVVPDGGAKLAAAEDALEEATEHVTAAEQELAEAEGAVEELNARRLQLQGEADELRRRLAAIEDDVDQVDEDLEEAEDTRDDAQVVLRGGARVRTSCGRGGRSPACRASRPRRPVGASRGSRSDMTDISPIPPSAELSAALPAARARDTSSGDALDGLSDYDVRRPMTPTGTSLLGLVKHVLSVELGYFGRLRGRPSGIALPWDNEEAFSESADMWATADRVREWLLDLYRRSWAHCDATVRELGLDAPAQCPVVARGAAGDDARLPAGAHARRDRPPRGARRHPPREIDGRGGRDHDEIGDEEWWTAYVAQDPGRGRRAPRLTERRRSVARPMCAAPRMTTVFSVNWKPPLLDALIAAVFLAMTDGRGAVQLRRGRSPSSTLSWPVSGWSPWPGAVERSLVVAVDRDPVQRHRPTPRTSSPPCSRWCWSPSQSARRTTAVELPGTGPRLHPVHGREHHPELRTE